MTDKTGEKHGASEDLPFEGVTPRHASRHRLNVCPHCGHPMPHDLNSLRLIGKQRRVYEMVAKAGALGIYSTEIAEQLYRMDPKGLPTGNIISCHVRNLNEKLCKVGLVVRARRGSARSPYRLLSLESPDED